MGLGGKEILERMRKDCRPVRLLASLNEVNDAMRSISQTDRGTFVDWFSEHAVTTYDKLNLFAVVPKKWIEATSPDYPTLQFDLHNIVTANSEAIANRYDYPPGIVEEASYDNGYWRAGVGTLAGIETNFFEPADALKGDFARIFLYVAAVYPQPIWQSRAAMLYADGYYPCLSAYGRDLLLAWHRSDPVDDVERVRDAAIAAIQGCGNPFVSEPDLVEYIWGRHADEIYGDVSDPGTPEKPDQPTEPATEPIMLKAVYSISGDRRIDFRSPYVTSGSEWSIDGQKVASASMSLDNISLGRHEISYVNDRSHGKIIITVEP